MRDGRPRPHRAWRCREVEPDDLDAARHRVLVRQCEAETRRAGNARQAGSAAASGLKTVPLSREFSRREARLDEGSGRRVGGIAQDAAVSAADDGVTALERGERTHRIQGPHQRRKPFAREMQAGEGGGAQPGVQRGLPGRGAAHPGNRTQLPQPAAPLTQQRAAIGENLAQRSQQALLQIVQSLGLLRQPGGRG